MLHQIFSLNDNRLNVNLITNGPNMLERDGGHDVKNSIKIQYIEKNIGVHEIARRVDHLRCKSNS